MKAIPLLAVWAVGMLLTGCGELVPGEAVRSEPSQSSYRDMLSAELRKQLDHAREVQMVDPCSLIDFDAAARLGTIKSVGTGSKPVECEIEYEVPKQPAADPEDGMTIVPGLPYLVQVGHRDLVTGGAGEKPENAGSMCSMRLFTGYEDGTGREAISYSLIVSGSSIGPKDPPPRCQDLEPLVNASRPFAAHPKARSESRRVPNSKLFDVDPCAVLDVLGGQQKIEISAPIFPFGCAFKPEGENQRSITFLFEGADEARQSVAEAKNGSSIAKYVDLLGVPATVYGPSGICMVMVYPDVDHPVSGSDPLSRRPWVPKVMVNVNEELKSCPKAVEVATEVARLYKAAK
ncbi:hypothetical protein DE4585_02668 [Mycobacteroides salmoniphilum]|uniref:DUF3558 domain-containing protein n=1 Tax=Mycobacteroides salmoniphilum TaxID=404941 RepID=A0A4R8S7M8_9MYCO|nr:hypothetical protein [Mycobacteroides salmoniphilum]TDZ82136.1 hypothetical protein DE4585_02668 [Mycobacteroides salmoniphilum]